MLIKDVFVTTNDGVYTLFKALYPDTYTTFYSDIDPTIVNEYFMTLYGTRTAIDTLSTNRDNIINMVIYRHIKKWQSIYNDLFGNYTPITNYSVTETHTGGKTNTYTKGTTVTDQVQGFNSSDFVTSTKSINDGNDTDVTVYDNYTIAKNGYYNIDVADMISNDVKIRQLYLFYDIIDADIINDISLSIYA